jgi:hypothetical protein
MSTWLVALIPVAVLATVFLFGFVGCTNEYGRFTVGSPDDGEDGSTYAGVVMADNPLAYWRLGEEGGKIAVDQVGLDAGHPAGNNPGSYQEFGPLPPATDSAPAPGTLTHFAPGLLPNDPGRSVDFDGGYMEVLHDGALNPGQFSLEAWVHPAWAEGDPDYRIIIASYVFGPPALGFDLAKNTDDHFEIAVGTGAGGWQTLVGDTSFQKGKDETYHLVATYDGATLKLYEDGVLSNQMPVSGYAPAGSTLIDVGVSGPTLRAPAPNSLYPFKGRIQEVAIYDHVLDENAVQTHYLAAL